MIEVQNIKKSFQGTLVLDNISGVFDKGKPNLIIGASGTGKSVLLKSIVGLIPPDEGSVLFDGRNFYKGDRDLKVDIRREIGMLFQGGALFDSKTVEENVRFPLDILTTLRHDEKVERVNFCLNRVGLKNQNKKMPAEISGGMQKRVGIARAIVNYSKYLFVDEPNSGLDPQTALIIDDLIAEITEEYDITTVVVTHDMNSVLQIGSKIMFMHKGQKLWEGTKEDILNPDVKELEDFVFANVTMKHIKR